MSAGPFTAYELLKLLILGPLLIPRTLLGCLTLTLIAVINSLAGGTSVIVNGCAHTSMHALFKIQQIGGIQNPRPNAPEQESKLNRTPKGLHVHDLHISACACTCVHDQ